MNGRRQPQSLLGLAAPGVLLIFLQSFEDALCRFRFEFLHDEGRGFGGVWLNQEMEMIGHQHPPGQEEMEFLAHLFQSMGKALSETV